MTTKFIFSCYHVLFWVVAGEETMFKKQLIPEQSKAYWKFFFRFTLVYFSSKNGSMHKFLLIRPNDVCDLLRFNLIACYIILSFVPHPHQVLYRCKIAIVVLRLRCTKINCKIRLYFLRVMSLDNEQIVKSLLQFI